MNIRFVRGVHDAMGTGLEFRRPRRGETTPSKNRGLARRLGLEQLEARQMLTATLLHTLNNPEPASVHQFGAHVAISGNSVVVGANHHQGVGGGYSGSAYLFDATSGALLHELNNPAPAYEDFFGWSVAISGNTIVVGAYAEVPLSRATNPGSAYVFDATTGALLRTLNNPTPAIGDRFGRVAISANTIVVGASGNDSGAVNSGSAYVFDAVSGALLHTLNNPTPAVNEFFGRVAISGNTIVVGALGDDTGATDAGSAYVFDAVSGALLHTLNNPTPAVYELFGANVAISGNTIVVGALRDDTGATDAGSAYVFDAVSGALLHTLNNPTPAMDDEFGKSVAISGNTIVVGAGGDDTGGESGERVCV